jgi:hypothetical protein
MGRRKDAGKNPLHLSKILRSSQKDHPKQIMSKKTDSPKPGDFCWNELVTTSVPAAKKFYSGLLGWKTRPFDKGRAAFHHAAHADGLFPAFQDDRIILCPASPRNGFPTSSWPTWTPPWRKPPSSVAKFACRRGCADSRAHRRSL